MIQDYKLSIFRLNKFTFNLYVALINSYEIRPILNFFFNKDRREVMHTDKKKYMAFMQESMNDIENMLMKAQEDICAKLGISQEILEKVKHYYEGVNLTRIWEIKHQLNHY